MTYLVSEAGADVNAHCQVQNYETALRAAITARHLEVGLRQRHALLPDITSCKLCALLVCQVVRFLVANGADLEDRLAVSV